MPLKIRIQADDFFNAYQVLNESNEVMMDKLVSLNGKPLVSQTAFGSFPTMTPSIVCLAFAVELYIKDLHFALKGKAPRGHNVLELFKKLPGDIQQEIRSYTSIQKIIAYYSTEVFPLYIPQDKNKKPITDILEQQIYKISDAFEKWRYSYENGTLNYEESTALALVKAVKSVTDNTRKP